MPTNTASPAALECAYAITLRTEYSTQELAAIIDARVRPLVEALEAVVKSYEMSNRELLRAGLLPEGKQAARTHPRPGLAAWRRILPAIRALLLPPR